MNSSSMKSEQIHGDSVKRGRNPLKVLAYEGGGVIVNSMRRREEAAGLSSPTPEPTPAPAPAPTADELDTKARVAAANAATKPKSFLSKLGFSEGGKIEGPGTGTSDSINATVEDTGADIRVSTGERILSVAQGELLQKLAQDLGFDSLDALLEQGTGKPVGPTMKDGVPAAAFGASDADLKNVLNAPLPGNQPRPPAPAMNPSMSNVTGVNRSGNSFSQDMSAAQSAAPAAAPAVQAPAATPATAPPTAQQIYKDVSLDGMKNALASAIPGVKREGNSFSQDFAKPAAPAAAPVASAPAAVSPITSAQAAPAAVAPPANATPLSAAPFKNGGASSLAGQGVLGNLVANGVPDLSLPKPPGGPIQLATDINGKSNPGLNALRNTNPQAGAYPEAGYVTPGEATPAGVSPPTNPLTQAAQGQQRAVQETNIKQGLDTSVNAGVTRQGNSFSGANVGEDMRNPLTSIDMAGNNASMAKANAIRQSMIDSQPAGGVSIIEDSGRKESQALMDKWDRQSEARTVSQDMVRNPKIANALAHSFAASGNRESAQNRDMTERATKSEANQTVRRGQDTHLQQAAMQNDTAQRGQDVTARGQDVSAQTAANSLAGNPLDNAIKQGTVDLSGHALKKAQAQDKMVADIGAEQDPGKRRTLMDTLLASQGKNPAEHRYVKVEGGEEIAPDGVTKVKRPSGVFDTINQRFIPMDAPGAAPAGPAQAKAVVPKVGGQVNAPDGTHTFQGKKITVVNGKITGIA